LALFKYLRTCQPSNLGTWGNLGRQRKEEMTSIRCNASDG
jgi:hypothetical protein